MKKVLITISMLIALAISSVADTKACLSCHGQNFERKALGKSKVVSDMTFDDINASLIGYKNGTYGGSMKGMMKGQVSKYSDAELTEMATEISKGK